MKYRVVFLLILSAICLTPLFIMLSGSVKAPMENLRIPPTLFPQNPTLENYKYLLNYPIGAWTINSLIITICFAFLNVMITISFGFGVVFKIGPRGRFLALCCIASIFFGAGTLLIPRYLLVRSLGLFNTRLAMILPFLPIPIYGLVSIVFLRAFPRYLVDAAEIDGCGVLRQLFTVIIPNSRTLMAIMGFASFQHIYDMFMWQALVAPAHKMKTLTVGVGLVVSGDLEARINSFPNFSQDMAAATWAFIPMLLLFLLCRKYFKSHALHQGVAR